MFTDSKILQMLSVFESLVSSMGSGDALLEKSNFPALLRLAQELENDELLSSLIGMIQPESFRVESLSLEEAILLLRIIYRQRLH